MKVAHRHLIGILQTTMKEEYQMKHCSARFLKAFFLLLSSRCV